MKKIFIILLSVFHFSFLFASEKLFSLGDNVNIREFPDKNSNIVGKINKGQKIEVLEIGLDWTKIAFNGKEAYVASEFVGEKPLAKGDIGFGEGFGQTYIYSAGIIAVLLTLPEMLKRRVSDRRYKQGFRQDKVPELTMWKIILIASIVSLPIGLIGGLICWIM